MYSEDGKIWTQHKNETDEAYAWFLEYVLKDNQDSLRDSFRQYLQRERGYTKAKANKSRNPSQKYINWSRGLNASGDKVVGLHTYDERLSAYRKALAEDRFEKIKIQRAKVLDKEYEHSQELIVIWEDMKDDFRRSYRQEKEIDNSFDSSNLSSKLKDLVRIREEISNLERKSVGMTNDVKEDIYQNMSIAKSEDRGIDWVKPPTAKEKFSDNEIDKMSDDEFEDLLRNGGDLYDYSES